jgi:hypothetical protein
LDDKLWIVGGQQHDDTWVSSDGQAWRQVATGAGWGGRWMHRLLAFEDRLYLIGGGGAPKGVQGDAWVLEGGDWRLVNAQAFSPRYMAATAVLQGRRVVLGGHGKTTAAGVPQQLLAEAQISADGGKTWTCHAAPWTPRWGAAAAVVGDTLYLMGGYRDGGTCGDVWATRDAIAWSRIGDAPWAATDLGQFAAAGMGDHLVLVGGVSRDDGPDPGDTGEKRSREVWAFKPPAG